MHLETINEYPENFHSSHNTQLKKIKCPEAHFTQNTETAS